MASGRRRVAREDGAVRAAPSPREQTHVESVAAAARRWSRRRRGGRTPSTRPRGRESARRPARFGAAAGGGAFGRGRREAGGRGRPGRGGASRASRARRSRRPSPKLTGTPSTRNGESGHDGKKTEKRTQVLDIHGRQKQQKRTSTFFEFCRATSGVLLCTDVAARGLDIPEVNWIVQFDPPDDPREYVHRVGRTARGETGTGRALLFLAPAELGFLRWLRDARVALHEYEFDMSKVTNIQSALTKLVEKNYYLHRAARDAYRSYLLAYASHAHKDIFDVHSLDLQAVSESFGFAVPPRVDLNLSHRGDKKTRRNPKKGDRRKGQSGHAFSAANPYGKRGAGDARQFSY